MSQRLFRLALVVSVLVCTGSSLWAQEHPELPESRAFSDKELKSLSRGLADYAEARAVGEDLEEARETLVASLAETLAEETGDALRHHAAFARAVWLARDLKASNPSAAR